PPSTRTGAWLVYQAQEPLPRSPASKSGESASVIESPTASTDTVGAGSAGVQAARQLRTSRSAQPPRVTPGPPPARAGRRAAGGRAPAPRSAARPAAGTGPAGRPATRPGRSAGGPRCRGRPATAAGSAAGTSP